MRDLKFRAWLKSMDELNGMHEVKSLHLNTGNIIISTQYGNQSIPPLQYDLMQYTGLKDKNGVEIYQGDLLHNPHDKNYCYAIVWNEDKAGFGLGTDDENLKPYQVHEFWEVIGNIYENPDQRYWSKVNDH